MVSLLFAPPPPPPSKSLVVYFIDLINIPDSNETKPPSTPAEISVATPAVTTPVVKKILCMPYKPPGQDRWMTLQVEENQLAEPEGDNAKVKLLTFKQLFATPCPKFGDDLYDIKVETKHAKGNCMH